MRNERSRPWSFAVISFAVALVAFTACGGDGSTIGVTLQEFAVLPAEDSVGAGEVTFEAENTGPDDNHELVVIRTDLAPEALPTAENGSVDEAGEGIEVIGEIEEFAPGETQSGTFTLEAGAYVLICNVVEETDAGVEAHYSLGMRSPFEVT